MASPSRFLPSEDSTDTHTLPNCLPTWLQGGSKISTEDALSLRIIIRIIILNISLNLCPSVSTTEATDHSILGNI